MYSCYMNGIFCRFQDRTARFCFEVQETPETNGEEETVAATSSTTRDNEQATTIMV